MLIMVTGGRTYNNRRVVYDALDRLYADPDADYICLIQGGARGADQLAREWCKARKIGCRTFHADWDRHGGYAGPKRNREMLVFGPPDVILAFPGGDGTENAVGQAYELGFGDRVIRVTDEHH